MDGDKQLWKRIVGQWCAAHPAMAMGMAIGCVLGLLTLFFGFWRTVLFLFFVVVGAGVGAFVDKPSRARVLWRFIRGR